MLQLATNLPDARVRLSPVLERGFDLLPQDGPDAPIEVVSHLRVEIDGVEKRPPDVVLHLAVRSVPDTHRSRPGIPRQVVERGLGELALPPIPYMICRSSSRSATSAMNEKKSTASQSKPSEYIPHSANVASRIHV